MQLHDRQLRRFWAKVEVGGDDDCWLWRGRPNDWGYGRFSVNNQTYYVHRFAYELLVGPIPDGLTVDHLCRTRLCANPRHLEPVPQSENSRRGIGKGSDSALTNVIQARTVLHMEETTTREPRDRIVVMRLTHSEYETLAAAARRDDRPVSAFVRLVLAAALKGERRKGGSPSPTR